MKTEIHLSAADALTLSHSATALGLHEFSLLARVQAGDINATRLRSGEIAIPVGELERLAKRPVPSLPNSSAPPEAWSDARLGITRDPFSGLKRQGEYTEYSVPGGDYGRFTETEMKGYRAAFSAIANEFASLGDLKKQLENPQAVRAAALTEISNPQLGLWQVQRTLLNLGHSDILLCEQNDEFAVIERFRGDSPYAQANGNAEILLQRDNADEVLTAFNANANHTLEFMASDQVATAQAIIWEQFPEHRPGRLMTAISERCRRAVTNEEMIEETIAPTQTIRRGMKI
jgi:hypothetical protein